MVTKNKNKQSGAIIIEATIALTTFMFAIVSILFVSHICYAQAKIGTVINGVAKDLSEFSYIYSLTGLAEKHSQLSSDGAQAKEGLDSVIGNLDDLSTALGNLKEVGSSLANDEDMQNSMLSLLGNEAANKASSIATGLITKSFAESRLSGTNSDCETVLKRLGVHKTRGTYLDSIDFYDSVFCVNGSSEIKVVARYSLKLITLLNVDITYDICQCAATKAWGAASKDTEKIASEIAEENNNENNDDKPEDNEEVTEETTQKLKTDAEIASECTINPSAPQTLLGSGSSLIADANKFNMSYLDVYSVKTESHENNADIDYVTDEFMGQQSSQGKEFFLNRDPRKVSDSVTKSQILWLQDHGYTFVKNTSTGLWKAVKE